jgi:hypothetical protein
LRLLPLWVGRVKALAQFPKQSAAIRRYLALSSGRVLKAMVAAGAALWTALRTASNSAEELYRLDELIRKGKRPAQLLTKARIGRRIGCGLNRPPLNRCTFLVMTSATAATVATSQDRPGVGVPRIGYRLTSSAPCSAGEAVRARLLTARHLLNQSADRLPGALAPDLIQSNQDPVGPGRHPRNRLTIHLGLAPEHGGRRNPENLAHPP